MPYRIEIDTQRGLVVTSYSGLMCRECAAAATKDYLAHPDFDPRFRALVDLTEVTEIEMDSASAFSLGKNSPYAAGAVLALVAPTDLAYGLARAFEVAVEGKGRLVQVFRDRSEAEAWLEASHVSRN